MPRRPRKTPRTTRASASAELHLDAGGLDRLHRQVGEQFSRAVTELRAGVTLLDQAGGELRVGDADNDARDRTTTLAALAQHVAATAARVALHVGELTALAGLGLITLPGSEAAAGEG